MSNLRYLNQPGPFWDFISSLENKDWSNHSFAAAYTGPSNPNNDSNMARDGDAEAWPSLGRGPWGFGGPHHGGRGPWGRGPPPGSEHAPPPPPPAFDQEKPSRDAEKTMPLNEDEEHEHMHPDGPTEPGQGPPPPPGFGRGLFGRRGGHGRGRGGPHGCGGRRGRGGPFSWGMGGGPFNMNNIAEFLQSQIFGEEGANAQNKEQTNGDFVPPVDIFDTETSFVIHVSLPGAKKEDIAVSWDAEKSEVNIAGVIHRPGDEEFLKTLALDERKVGAFARKVKLGSKLNPAQVDADGMSAKLEDGILRVNVPKEEREFDVIHKVDIE